MTSVDPPGRPRVLYVVNVGWFFLSHRLVLARAAIDRGYEVHVACGIEGDSERSRIVASGIVLHELSIRRSSGSLVNAWVVARQLRAIISRVQPRVVHLVALKVVLIGGLVARRVPGRRIVAAFSGLGHLFTDDGWKARILRRLIMPGFLLALRGEACRVLFQNADDRAVFTDRGVVPLRRTELIRGVGVDLTAYSPVPEPDDSPPLVVLPARVLREKGVCEFALAARMLSEAGIAAEYAIAGDPDAENPSSLSVAELADLERKYGVRSLGFVHDMPALLAQCGVVCLPSYREGMPKALAEAAAAGRPLVATDVPGCREAVVDGENGFLVPARDPAALAEALGKLIRSASLRRQMGVASRRLAEERFDEVDLIARTLALYE